jgi:hypothetical protein
MAVVLTSPGGSAKTLLQGTRIDPITYARFGLKFGGLFVFVKWPCISADSIQVDIINRQFSFPETLPSRQVIPL